jgi:hypothetical protein
VNVMLNKISSQYWLIAGLSLVELGGLFAPRLLASSVPTEVQKSNQPSVVSNTLRSTQGIDYAPLQQLLQDKKWQEANQLTSILVLKAARQEQQGYLRATDIRILACSDLQIVDHLWKSTSNRRFGLSTQAAVWRNLKGASYEDSLRFEQQVGWNSDQATLIGDPSTVPVGYFPFRPAGKTGIKNAFGGWWIREMPIRLQQCTIR